MDLTIQIQALKRNDRVPTDRPDRRATFLPGPW